MGFCSKGKSIQDFGTIQLILKHRPITGQFYELEFYYRDWATVAQNVRETSYKITDLQKQRSYYFRVQAENQIGKSEALQTKEMFYIKQHVGK